MSNLRSALFGLMCVLALGACSSMPAGVQDAINSATLPAQTAQDRVHVAMQLLEAGREDRAKSLLETVLRQEPGNATATQLLNEINADPHVLLGQRSRAYVVREDDTMSSLAEHYLGDPLMFYALARYNSLTPNALTPGSTIQIPDRRRTVTASARPAAPTPSPTQAATVPAPVVVAVNSDVAARANRLRLQGLEHLNAGDADAAVTLLGQARSLDSSNPAIQSDLNRAQRIQASLRAQ